MSEDSPEVELHEMELDEQTNSLDKEAVREAARIEKFNNYQRMFERVEKGEVTATDAAKKLADIDTAKDNQLRSFRDEKNRLSEEVLRDPLTGLYNKRWYDSELKVKTAEANAFPEKKLTLVFFDIDFFKKINTQYGHPVGDRVIQAIAQLSREDEPIARIGGEEFVQLVDLSNIRSEQDISDEEKLKSLRDRYAHQVHEVTQSLLSTAPIIKDAEDGVNPEFATLSIGATKYIQGENPDQFHERANGAMHQSKNNGRNQITFLDPAGVLFQYPEPHPTAA